jgi:hypothetical protein
MPSWPRSPNLLDLSGARCLLLFVDPAILARSVLWSGTGTSAGSARKQAEEFHAKIVDVGVAVVKCLRILFCGVSKRDKMKLILASSMMAPCGFLNS